MKRLALLLALVAIGGFARAQMSNLVFFAEQGEPFLVILNGIQQNGSPETNVRITELNGTTCKVKIIFEDTRLGEIDKTIFLEPGTEYTCNIKKNQKGEYVIRLLSQVPMAQAPPPPPAQHIIVYTTTPAPAVTTTTSTVVTGTSVTTTAPAGVSVNAGGVSAGVSVTGVTSTVTTTTTTSSVSTTSTGDPTPTKPPVAGTEIYVLPGYNGPYGCNWPMDDDEFNRAKQSVQSKTFEDSKLTIAKQIVGANCLLCSQVKELMELFDFESTRLDFAKFAYRYTLDRGNYYQLNDAFQFESSIDELNQYINGR